MSIPNEETRQAHIHATAATTCPPEITATMLQHMHAPKQTKNTRDVAARHIFFLCFFWGASPTHQIPDAQAPRHRIRRWVAVTSRKMRSASACLPWYPSVTARLLML